MVPEPADADRAGVEERQLADDEVVVRIWGARGSVACPGPETVRYGGNTPCVEVCCGNHRIVFDGGTGIRELGRTLISGDAADMDVFLTHFHLDHISGLPFFAAAYRPGNRITLHAARLDQPTDLRDILCKMMSPPLFPVPIDEFKAAVSFTDFSVGDRLEPKPGVIIETAALNHPGGACGYRLRFAGRTVAYVTDTEHPADGLDGNVLALMADADVAIYDATFTDEEYARHVGWGHSTWRAGIAAAEQAGARQLVLFHHDPSHTDADLDRIAVEAAAVRPGTLVAREGMVLRP